MISDASSHGWEDGTRRTPRVAGAEPDTKRSERPSARALGAGLRFSVAISIAISIAITGAIALDAAPSRADDEAPSAASEGRQVARQIFDLALLRPLQLGQVVVSAAVFLPAYPVGLLVGEGDYVTETCIREPVDRAFRRPLGAL